MFNNYHDFFTATALLEAIAETPYVPGQLADIYETRALSGTKLALEEQPANGGTELMTATPRGTPSKAATLARRKVHTFDTAHYRVDGAVYADEVLNMRATGANAVGELITARRDETLAMLRRNLDLTLESLRLTTLITPNNAFGSKPAAAALVLANDATKTRQNIYQVIIKPMEAALAGIPFSGIKVLCSTGFWEALLGNKEIRDAYLYLAQAQSLTGDTRDTVTYAGVTFERYRGAGSVVITANEAIAIPMGVPSLFIQAFGPADTLDSVGAGGIGRGGLRYRALSSV